MTDERFYGRRKIKSSVPYSWDPLQGATVWEHNECVVSALSQSYET